MLTLNYAVAQVVQQERAQELEVAAHSPLRARSPRNVRSLRAAIASLRREYCARGSRQRAVINVRLNLPALPPGRRTHSIYDDSDPRGTVG